MLYGQFIDELLTRLKVKKDDPENRAVAGIKINKSYKEVGNITNVNWESLKRVGEIVSIANYKDGTVTITNGSRGVTGSNTTWTSSMEGRFFKPLGGQWYKIAKVNSATSLTLYSPIQQDSAANITYIIWKRFYYFPSEVKKVLDFGSWILDGKLTDSSFQKITDLNSDISLTGQPFEFSMFGIDPLESEYTTGTVSLTENSRTATGSGTSWLGNVEPGDIFEVSGVIYRVKRVESDTSLILVQYATQTIASVTYSARKEQNLGFQFWYNADDGYVFPFNYIKRVYDMVNEEKDKPELPDEFDGAILDGAEADRLSDLDDAKWINKQALYSARINDLKTTRFVSSPRTRIFRPLIKSRGGYW